MSYDDICPIFKAMFNTNVAFIQKKKEQIKEEESRALKRLNETLAEKATKRQKLDEEVEELKRHLQIVPNEDDDVYTEATPLTRKVHVVDYEIIEQNKKPYYKIIRANDASEGFEQILDFLNSSVIQYALVVNPTIYVSCIKQFWSSVSLKKTNDVVRLQALIDRRKVIITEDTIRQALRLDDADSID
nr:hypothetical protein [Tanacetum cinerariifolium]